MWARFTPDALFEFLGRVDRELSQPCTIFVIGGSAVATIDPRHSTTDLDLMSPGSREFDAAVERLRQRGEPVIPVQVVTIATGPAGLEDRAEKVDMKTATKLTVFVPERHDLAMMKLARGYENDLEALEGIHLTKPFELATLVARFDETDVIGPRRRFALALLDLIARLFGEEEAAKHQSLLDKLKW